VKRAALAAIAVALTGCFYWPFAPDRPHGQSALDPGLLLSPSPPAIAAAHAGRPIVLRRFESSYTEPAGAVYAPSIAATIDAADAPIAIFECTAEGLRRLGFDVRKDYAQDGARAAIPGASEANVHVDRLRIDAVQAGDPPLIAVAEMHAAIAIRAASGQPIFDKDLSVAGHLPAEEKAGVPCALGYRLAEALAADPAFARAAGGAP
jgi:hypothetical protein